MVGLIRQLAYEFAPVIRVNGVAPEPIETDLRGPAALGLADQAIDKIGLTALAAPASRSGWCHKRAIIPAAMCCSPRGATIMMLGPGQRALVTGGSRSFGLEIARVAETCLAITDGPDRPTM